MAHEFESGFFVGQAAWHGLGTVLPDAPSVEEAIKLAGLDWNVVEAPLAATVGGDRIGVPGHKAIVRESDATILGIVTNAYRPFQNSEAFGWMQPIVDDGTVRLEAAGSLQEGRKVWILARYGEDVEVTDGDRIVPYLLLATGHDGKLSVRITNTPVRVVCMNTARAALGNVEDEGMSYDRAARRETRGGFAVPHMGNVAAKVAAARSAILAANKDLGLMVEAFRRMAKVPVSEAVVRDFARKVFDADYVKAQALIAKFRKRQEMDADITIRVETQKAIRELEDMLAKETRVEREVVAAFREAPGADLAGPTAWGAFNAATWRIDHDAAGKPTDRKLASSWFGNGAARRQRAFDLALEMTR